jgi:small subunit ribosomal protein S6
MVIRHPQVIFDAMVDAMTSHDGAIHSPEQKDLLDGEGGREGRGDRGEYRDRGEHRDRGERRHRD